MLLNVFWQATSKEHSTSSSLEISFVRLTIEASSCRMGNPLGALRTAIAARVGPVTPSSVRKGSSATPLNRSALTPPGIAMPCLT